MELELERVCVLHFVAGVEQTCADMRRETALGKASRERRDEIERYISERGEKLVRVATSGHRLSGQLKNRVLSLFLILMNLRENLDRSGKPGVPARKQSPSWLLTLFKRRPSSSPLPGARKPAR